MEDTSKISSSLLQGMNSYITDDYKTAVKHFSEFLNTHKNNLEGLLYRANAYLNLGLISEALTDLTEAEKVNQNSFDLYYKKGIAAFKLEQFLDAGENFKKALSLATNSEQRDNLVIWTNKLEIELIENDLMPRVTSAANESDLKFNHNWYQNATTITLTVECNTEVHKENFDILIEKKALKIIHKESGKTVWEMELSNSIVPDGSTFILNKRKVEFKLKKEVENFNWITVDRAKVIESMPNFQPSYPTSSKIKKDWDHLEKEINQELTNDAKNDPNEGMMKLFKDIFERADENTRRAMMKSFQTSGGTVLSTNWDEVKEKDYEGKDRPEAPKGQEWRKHDA
jgi:tetratricopeptide (TPR) repeat protein